MPDKPLTLTSAFHAFALAIYMTQLVLGVEYLLGVAKATALTGMIGHTGFTFWAYSLSVAGVIGLICSFTMATSLRPARVTIVEAFACTIMVVANLLYEYSLYSTYKLDVATTQTQTIALFWAGFLRIIQIVAEALIVRHRLKNAQPVVRPQIARANDD